MMSVRSDPNLRTKPNPTPAPQARPAGAVEASTEVVLRPFLGVTERT